MKYIKRFPCVLLALLLAVLGGCGQQAVGWSLYNQDGTVVLQALVSQDDPVAPAMEQAAADLSEEAGVPVQLLLSQDISDYDITVDEMFDQVESNTVAGVVVGRDFEDVRTVRYLYRTYGVPVIAMGNSAATLNTACIVNDFYSAEDIAAVMCESLAARSVQRVAVLYSRTTFETELVRTLSDQLEAAGIQLSSLWSVKDLRLSPAHAADEWKLLEVDAVCVICSSSADVPALVTKLRTMGASQPMLFADNGFSDSLSEQAAAAMEGDLFIPEYPDAQQQAYDAVWQLGHALLNGDGTAEAALAALKDEDGYLKQDYLSADRIVPKRMTDGLLTPEKER